jgi:putative SOS response-associated peptidase YedK
VEYDLPEEHPYAYAPNYNITPDSFQPVVRLGHESGEREFSIMKWGLVPYWSKTAKAGFSSINARNDKLESSGAWREPFKRRRCLIPAEFFFEWQPQTPEEQQKKITKPFAVSLTADSLFSFGGIFDFWKDKVSGDSFESFAIVTVEPNELLEPFHNRCPLIVESKDYERWLTPYAKEDPASVPVELLRTYPSEAMKAWRVNPIGRGANGPALLEPFKVAPTPEAMPGLFSD